MDNNLKIDLRASSGTVVNNFRTGYKVQVSWTVNSQNIANNTSNVTFKAQFVSTGSSYTVSSSATKNGSLTINGTKYSFTFNASLSGGQTKTVFTKTVDIPHNSDGTKTCSIATTLGINITLSGKYWGDVTASGSGTFNSIPRVSTFSINTDRLTIGSTQCTVTINKSSSSFTHKVYYRFGNINWLAMDSGASSVTFTPSISDCSQIPNSTTGTGSILVETWNGSTKLGQNSKTITLVVPDHVKPSISGLTAELIANGVSTSIGYLQNKSQCRLTINGASGSYGSSVTNYSITGGGYSSSAVSTTTPVLTQSGTITYTAQITDSRGRKSDTRTVSISVNAYAPPKILEFVGERCLINGEANDDGTYIKIYTRYSHTSLGGQNRLTARVGYRKNGATSFTYEADTPSTDGAMVIGKATSGGAIETTSGYEVRLFLDDDISPEVAQSIAINTSFVTMDFKKGGKGIAIGKASETDNLFEVAMNTNIIGKLTVNGKDVSSSPQIDTSRFVTKDMVNVIGSDKNTVLGKIPYVNTDGVMEVGKYIDFHDNGSNVDYSARIQCNGSMLVMPRLSTNNWYYSTGNTGWYNESYGGGWFMQDSTWLRAYGNKGIYTGGRIKTDGAIECRYIDSTGGNLDINNKGATLFINANASSGANLNINRKWSGSSGTEVSLWNNKGKGWGFLGNTDYSFYRVYGTGGSVSARESKYDIQKYDTETLYNYVKDVNVYGYRTISDERDEDGNVINTHKRSDLSLGCMVDELPTEAVFYDNEDGTGRAVDNYSYTTMILGALQETQKKVEALESEVEDKDRVISDLEQRLSKLEEMILNGNN
ncbi:TPA: shufflon system plasmid conjugative transfer pilus tip adhesin PilV [Clostridioides difficile]|nr:shufflon system plasmid conjugative transfer pilus tip adhesin PilV [Clostridioides difficile]